MSDNITNPKRKVNADEDRSDKLKKLARLDDTNAIKVTFGDLDSGICIVHQEIICKHSTFFKEQCTKTTPRGTEREVHLSKIRRRSFQVYLDWVHLDGTCLEILGEDVICEIHQHAGGCKTTSEAHAKLHILVDLWVMGAELQDHAFQEEVIRRFFRYGGTQQVTAAACKALRDTVFKRCATDSTMCRLFLDLLERRLSIFGVRGAEIETCHKKVIIELLQRRNKEAGKIVPLPLAQDYIRV